MKPSILATTAVLGAVLLSTSAIAQQKTMYLGSYGGSFEQTMRKDVLPAFEAKHNVKVEYVAGNSTDTLAKLQAQKGNQQIDAIIVDDGPSYQAVSLGFCDTLQPADIYKDVYPVMKYPSNKAVGIGLNATGIVYSKKAFEENKWPAPTSWADLKDPKYKKKLVIPPLNNTYGLHTLIVEAELGGGGVNNIEPGFNAFKDQIGPNVLAYEPSPGKMTELFQSGQAVIGVWGSGRVKALAETGFPAEFVYPKEGGIALGVAICPVAGSKNGAEAQALVQYMLTPEVQKIMAKGAGLGPSNMTVKLSAAEQVGVPYGDQVKQLKAIDWDVVNAKREEWNKRWVREIER
jgi:putative spermidine/putrescine transport system substrate-binding protein